MWALVENDEIVKVYPRPTAITVGFVAATYYEEGDELPILSYYEEGDELPEGVEVGDVKTTKQIGDLKTPRLGTNYPSNIMSMWTASELEAIGIYEVVQDNTNLKNVGYYMNGAGSIDFADGVVTQSYAAATAKSLDDILWTQEYIDSMDPAPEGVSVGDLRERGLKFLHKAIINNKAGGILAVTDWYRIREDDGGTEMPAAVLTFRTAIRTESNTMCGLIDAVADVDELAALYIYSGDPSTRPLGEWSILE